MDDAAGDNVKQHHRLTVSLVAELFNISEGETRLFQVEGSASPTVIRELSSFFYGPVTKDNIQQRSGK